MSNTNINRVLQEENVVRMIKAQRIRWSGHVYRQRDEGIRKINGVEGRGSEKKRSSKSKKA